MRTTLALALLFSCLTGILVTVESSSEEHDENAQLAHDCAAANGIKHKDLEIAKDLSAKDIPEAVKCSIFCMYRKKRLVNDNGKLLVNNLKDGSEGSPQLELIKTKCAKIEDKNKCETGFLVMRCIEDILQKAGAGLADNISLDFIK